MNTNEYIDFTLSNLQKELNYVELQSKNISDVFVSHSADDNEDDEDLIENEDSLTPVTDVILNNNRVVLLGDPGAGKSTVVNYLVQMFCNRRLNGDDCIIPFLIKLKDIHSVEDWNGYVSVLINNSGLQEELENGNIMLFLDGLNELPSDAYNSIVNRIREFIEEYDNISLLVTSRKYGYKKILPLDEYQIHEFDDKAIKSYIEKRTGNSKLFDEMIDMNIISSDSINPLMLKMIIDVWEKNGILPGNRSQLYSAYIDYQLEKSFPCQERLHKALLSIMEQVAFNMRKNGFISDHEDEVKNVIGNYVKEKDVDTVASLMLRSGLLCMDIVSSKFHFISFVHESFQEYLSSLYIASQFKNTGSLCIPIESYVWRDALKSVSEIISLEKNDSIIVSLLDAMNLSYMNASSNEYINEYLEQMVSCCVDASKVNETCYSWMFQYLFLQMENYLKLDYESKTEDYFDIIVTSALKFGDMRLIKRLFIDSRWQREWLFESVDELDEKKRLPILSKEYILCKAFEQSSNRIAVYYAITELMKKFAYNSMYVCKSLSKRLEYAEHIAWKLLSSNEHKCLYETTGNAKDLFYTFDVDYIKSELERNDAIPLDHSIILMTPRFMDCCAFYLEYICPRLIEKGMTRKILGSNVVSKIIYNQDIQRLLLKNPLFEAYKKDILDAFYMIPDEDICEEYFDYIKVNRGPLLKSKGVINDLVIFKLCDKVDSTYNLYQLCCSSLLEDFDIQEAIVNTIPDVKKDDIVYFHKYKFYKDYLAEIPTDEYIIDINDGVLDGQVFAFSYMRGRYTVYTKVSTLSTTYSPRILRGDLIRIGDDVIKVDKVCYKAKAYIGVVSKEDIARQKVHIEPKNPIHDMVLDVEQLPMYRNSELMTLKKKNLSDIGQLTLVNYGLISMIPGICKNVIEKLKLYVVTFVNKDIVVFANDNKSYTTRNNKCTTWEIGDIAYKLSSRSLGSDVFFKLYNPELYSDKIFSIGEIVPSSRNGLLIKDVESGKLYSNPTMMSKIEGKVSFFPVVKKKKDGKEMYVAYRVSKIE